MSSVVISGDTSGAITLAAPAVSGTNTATLPAATGTVMVSGNMPAFAAYAGSTLSVSSGTWTKMQCNTEEFDTNSYYDNSTNYRFQPLIAGYYQINGGISAGAFGSTYFLCAIYKNGSVYKSGSNSPTNAGAGPTTVVSSVVYFNGSTDYVELYGLAQTAFTAGSGVSSTYFNGAMIRTA